MYHITQKDKTEILKILFEHDCKCKMSDLVKEYSYLNYKKNKKEKIREVIRKLNKELNEVIEVQIIEIKGYVEIIF